MRASSPPPTVEDRRAALRDRFAEAAGALLCLDFDGTLAPIVDQPDDAAMAADCRSLVGRLAQDPPVDVAVISGRAIDDLQGRVDVDGVVYAGNHGLELKRRDHIEVVPEADEQRDAIDDVCAEIEAATESIPGVAVEHKGITATVHYRQVPEERVPEVVESVDASVADVAARMDAPGEPFEVVAGKQIREIRPRVDWDKGRVVELLAEDVPDDWDVVYVGDDTTDEDAFEVVEPQGLGVAVGDTPDTAASVRVPDQDGVADFLELVTNELASD
ncbi:trehalose 6-phosphate phosphatase [Halomicrobium zhouii]|uniref:Trehalose 6-phosphate phosphatase n=1 Tax=Halomicrobium zhouii TaxID=767519 RepID=A0A1I6M1Z3_9EURY|nr:trehalose-phosphatase [Halomicrobium zhouii]SFS09654.1 trehalose 6-phosphate phosphatase [Halomicrobium zhouii]